MKIKDFLKQVATQGQITDQDLEAVLAASALNEIELPETFVSSFNGTFLTKDRAKNDPAIVSEIIKNTNKTAFNTFDEKANGFVSMLDPDDQEKVKNTKETYEKYDIIKAGLKKVLATKGKGGEADVRKVEEEWSQKLQTAEQKYKSDLDNFKKEYDNVVVNSFVKSKILAANFAEPFKTLKDSIADLTVNKIRAAYKLQLEKGSVAVMQDVDGMLREVYDGNQKVTLDSLLEKELKPFIAVSNGKGANDKKEEKAPVNTDRSKLTLAELRQLQATGAL